MTKDIKNYEGIYSINTKGEVFSYPKKTRKGFRKIKPILYSNGYMVVDLCKNGKVKKVSVHRLVAEQFIPNPLNKEQVNHINGIKSDNRLENLEWNTRSENQRHSILTGLRSAKGSKNSQAKLDDNQVLTIFKDARKCSYIATDFGISINTVYDIKSGRSWSHLTKQSREIKS